MNDLMLNELPAPYRRDLRGEDLLYELSLVMSKMQIGDVLRFSEQFLHFAGPQVTHIKPPWPYTMERRLDLCEISIKRDA